MASDGGTFDRDFDPVPAAIVLADAARRRVQLRELPDAIRPRTVSEGYDVQDALVAELGEAVSGWKLGVGSANLKRLSGVGKSLAGRILTSRLFVAGAAVPFADAASVTVECEICYRLGVDVLPDRPPEPVSNIISETYVAFELVQARFVDRRAVGWPSFVADNAGFSALVLGEAMPRADGAAFRNSLRVCVDTVEVARAAEGDDATDADAALLDLIQTARERDMVLPQGSLVSTGSASRPFILARASARISARFLGRTMEFDVVTI